VLYGYYVLCSNAVAYRARERLRTILAVTRTITSAADGLSGGQAGRNRLCIPVSNGEVRTVNLNTTKSNYHSYYTAIHHTMMVCFGRV
jgi:hypothetical protein